QGPNDPAENLPICPHNENPRWSLATILQSHRDCHPEQGRGEPSRPSRRTYAFGALCRVPHSARRWLEWETEGQADVRTTQRKTFPSAHTTKIRVGSLATILQSHHDSHPELGRGESFLVRAQDLCICTMPGAP